MPFVGEGTRSRSALRMAAIVGLLAGGCTAAPQNAQPSGSSVPVVQPGQMAPEFTLPQANGDPVTLSDLRGNPVLLYFSMGPG
jgi:cytochrome oxidase Cu insertion factor (SCO1/SenC/PrrC family)